MRNCLSKIINFKVYILFFLITAQSCNYRTVQGSSQNTTAQDEINVFELSNNYESVQQIVISKQCLQCHSESGGNKGNLNLETYSSIRNNLNQIMFRVIEKNDMPEGGLSQADYQLMKLWIESGAPEKNTANGANKPIAGPLDWIKIKNQILVKNCLDCHSGGNADANLDLSSAEAFKFNLTKIIERTVVKQDMPPEPYTALTANERQALLKWISQGFPQ
jgi:uncharacterized membrane protein